MMAEILRALLETNLALAAAIAFVIAVRKPARRLLGARAAYGLWAVPAAAAIAVLFPARLITIVLPPPAPYVPTPTPTATFPDLALSEAAPPAFAPPTPSPALPPLDSDVLLVAAWTLGALAFALWLTARQRQFMADLRKGQGGPAVVGFLRPRIVTPADFDGRFSEAERRAILAHEQTHLTRQDARVNGLVALVRCLCWFNPLIHLAAHLMRVDQELACDAQVVARHPTARRTYAEALIKTQLATRPLPLGCYWPSGTLHPLTERIAMLTRPSPTRRGRLAGAALLIALIGSGAAAAWAAQPARARFVTPDRPAIMPAPATIPSLANAAAITPEVLAGTQAVFGAEGIDSSDYDPDRPIAFRARLVSVSEGLSDVILQLQDDAGQTWLASGVRNSAGRRFAIEDQIGVTVGVTGFRKRGDACDGPCLMIARELAFADGTRLFRGLGSEFEGKGLPAPPTSSSAEAVVLAARTALREGQSQWRVGLIDQGGLARLQASLLRSEVAAGLPPSQPAETLAAAELALRRVHEQQRVGQAGSAEISQAAEQLGEVQALLGRPATGYAEALEMARRELENVRRLYDVGAATRTDELPVLERIARLERLTAGTAQGGDSRTAALSAGDWRRASMLGATSAEVVRALQARGQYREADPERATVAINTDGAILRVYNMSPLPPLPAGARAGAILGGQNSESFDLPVGALILRPGAPAERKGAPLPGGIPRPPELPPGTFPFAAVFDGNDPIEMTGRILAIDWTDTYVQLTFVDDRNGQVHRIIGGQSIYATPAQRQAIRVGRASVRGYRALDKSCSGYCLVHGRDITYGDGARASLSGFTLPALAVPPAA